jgi:hypothetical protein
MIIAFQLCFRISRRKGLRKSGRTGIERKISAPDDVHTLGVNIKTIKKKAEETKFMVRSHHRSGGENHNLFTGNESFKNVTKFKYLDQQ